MKRIKVVLLDDEINSIKSLKLELSKFPEIHFVKEFINPHLFLEAEKNLDYHALFLDLDMPAFEINGKDIAQKLNKPIIFVTAHNTKYADYISEMADMGDNYVALIPKTYKKERIEIAIKKLNERLKVIRSFVEWNNTTDSKLIELKTIQVITTKDYSKDNLPPAGRDKFLYRDGKKRISVSSKNLDECMFDLPSEYFFKINDSHIINKTFISEVGDKDILIKITVSEDNKIYHKEERIKISPTCAEKFKAFFYA
jgi:DNA-binding LytR/AlgR family response regulator